MSAALAAAMAGTVRAESPLVFERVRVGDVTYESASAADINNDGRLDIVSGEYWFEGPEFTQRHRITSFQRVDDYYDTFSDFPMDVNGDGYVDIITGGWWGMTLRWEENPAGRDVEWKLHDIDKTGNVETTRFWDVDGDGHLDAVPNAGGNVVVFTLKRDASGKPAGAFDKHVIRQGGCGHGLGFGDVNGDGRGDFVIPEGWLEAPERPWAGEWKLHAEFQFGGASVPILVHDVNEDGKADLIVGQGHDYGLAWYEQGGDASRRTWTRRDIDPDRSQYHDLMLADIDKDGRPELLTGKRFRAHAWADPGSRDPVGVYYFEIEGGRFTRRTIDYGPAGRASGVGIYLWVADLDNNSWLDLVCPGKDGLYVFYNRGRLEGVASAE